MTTTYTTVDNVGNLLGFPDSYFDTQSTPSSTVIERFINRAEDRIDSVTNHGWRTKTVINEYVRPSSVFRVGTGIRLDLIHRSNVTLTKLEVWENNEWNDWVANKTEGRDKDYWVDEDNGAVYLVNIIRLYPHGVRISYTFGETSVSGGIEDATTMMAASMVLNSPEFSSVLFTQAGENRPNYDSEKNYWKEEIKSILENNTEFQ